MNIETEAFALNDYFNKIIAEYKKISKKVTSYQTNSYLKEEADNLYRRIQDFRSKYYLFIKERKNTFGKFNVTKYVEFHRFTNRPRGSQRYLSFATSSLESKASNQKEHCFDPVNSPNDFKYGVDDRRTRKIESCLESSPENKAYGDFTFQRKGSEQSRAGFHENYFSCQQGLRNRAEQEASPMFPAAETGMKELVNSSGPMYTDQKIVEWRDEQYDPRQKRRNKGSKSLAIDDGESEKAKMEIEDIRKRAESAYKEDDYRKYLPLFLRNKELAGLEKSGSVLSSFGLDSEYLQDLDLRNEHISTILRKCDLFLSEVFYLSCVLACSKTEKTLTSEDLALIMKTANNIDIPGFPVIEDALKRSEGFKEILLGIKRKQHKARKASKT